MKIFCSIILLFLFPKVQAQLISGELFDSKRKMTSVSEFTIVSNYEGHVVYEIAVDIYGKVTSERWIADKSTVKSTPANIQAKNLLKDLKFEPGEYYPVFHHGLVKVKFVKHAQPSDKQL